MRNLQHTLFLFFSLFSFVAKSETVIYYVIKTDTLDTSVQEGYTRVYGKATSNGTPIEGVRISSLDHQHYAITDKEGNYTFLVKTADTMVYAYKPWYNEIVTSKISFKSKHKVEVDFYMEVNNRRIDVAKPVIYLYSNNTQDFSLTILSKGEITYAYPTYINKWEGEVKEESKIVINKKEYPYLFWEGWDNKLNFIHTSDNTFEGFHIKQEEVIPFLEENLKKLGLNNTEKTDFITFWAPKMIKYPEVLVQFLVDKDYSENIAKVELSPTPISSRRVYMLFKPYNGEELHLVTPTFSSIKREGFTLIEWGGSELPSEEKKL